MPVTPKDLSSLAASAPRAGSGGGCHTEDIRAVAQQTTISPNGMFTLSLNAVFQM